MHRSPLPVLALAVATGWLSAQTPLQFDVVGGSIPGPVSFDLHPGILPFDAAVILTGIDPGPTSISLFDWRDTRQVNVGTAMLSNSMFGFFGLDLHFRPAPLNVPAQPVLQDAAFYFQGITLPGTTTLVDRISLPRVVRLGVAGAFRDRLVGFQDDRAFPVVLPHRSGGWLLCGGGRGGLLAQTAHRTTEIYDPLTDSFSFGPNLTVERSLHTATRLADGRWLIAGGVDRLNDPQAACEIYDPAANTFTVSAPMLSPRAGHTATLLADGRVLVTGGLVAMTVTPSPLNAIYDTTNTTEIYQPATNTWVAGPNLRTPRVGHAAIVRPDNRVALCGGISWDDFILFRLPAVRSSVDLFNPANNTIAAGPAMASARSMIEAVPLGNHRWLMAGGINAVTLANQGTPTNTAEIYDAMANTWTAAGAMSTARGLHKGWALGNGRFLIAGGADGTLQAPNPHASTDVYDAASNQWSVGPSLNAPRTAFGMFETPTGQVHVMGGGSSLGAISNSSEWYYR